MKTASAATLAILSTGQYYKAELYEFDLKTGGSFYFTNSQVPITVGGQLYSTGLVIVRSSITQQVGLDVQSLEINFYPQYDSPSAPVLMGGVTFIEACRNGLLDAANFKMSKLFLSNWNDTSPGAILWFNGIVNTVVSSRSNADITINSLTDTLNVSMPPNVFQSTCSHALYDAGCTLSRSSFQVTGTVTGTPTVSTFNTGLTQPNNYFALGVITFTSGANVGQSRTIKSFLNSGGNFLVTYPFAVAPAAGDTFTAVPGCPKTQAACSNTNAAVAPAFNNLIHFRGEPYIPIPETLYDGGTNNPPVIIPITPGSPSTSKAFFPQ